MPRLPGWLRAPSIRASTTRWISEVPEYSARDRVPEVPLDPQVRRPIFSKLLLTASPGVAASTRKADSPASPGRPGPTA
jgi:hypothetical protein